MVIGKKRVQGKWSKKFNARIDKNTSMTFYERDMGIDCVIRKDLVDYETHIFPSESPITNDFLKRPDPYETTVADISIFDKEIVPIKIALYNVFGPILLGLEAVRLCIGSSVNDYVTIDESDLFSLDVEPSLEGLLEFIQNNK